MDEYRGPSSNMIVDNLYQPLMPTIVSISDPAFGRNSAGTIYHYAPGAAIDNILASGSLWMSEVSSLNDMEEQTFTKDLLLWCMPEIGGNRAHVELLSKAIMRTRMDRCFLASFSRCSDLLGQWTRYTDPTGACLGFPIEVIEQASQMVEGFVTPVIYDRIEQIRISKKFLNIVLSSMVLYDYNGTIRLSPNFSTELCALCLMFKSASWSEEQEVRVIAVNPPVIINQRLRVGGTVTRYLNLDYRNAFRRLSPPLQFAFNHILPSPGVGFHQRAMQIADKIDKAGYTFGTIQHSRIAYVWPNQRG